MESVVFQYTDMEDELLISIGNYRYMKNTIQTAKQLVRYMGYNHDDDRWDEIMDMEEEELYDILGKIANSDPRYIFYPN